MSAINLSALKNLGTQATTTNNSDKPKAKFWLNIGYVSDVKDEDGTFRFVSLPMGIPLDTMDAVKTRSSNPDYAMFQAARNDLLTQILEAAEGLAPGQDYVINAEGGMAIQIRRILDEVAAPKTDESNHYARPKLFAVG